MASSLPRPGAVCRSRQLSSNVRPRVVRVSSASAGSAMNAYAPAGDPIYRNTTCQTFGRSIVARSRQSPSAIRRSRPSAVAVNECARCRRAEGMNSHCEHAAGPFRGRPRIATCRSAACEPFATSILGTHRPPRVFFASAVQPTLRVRLPSCQPAGSYPRRGLTRRSS